MRPMRGPLRDRGGLRSGAPMDILRVRPTQEHRSSVEPPKRIVPLCLFGYLAVAVLIAALGTFGLAPSQTGVLIATGGEAMATRLAPVAHVEFASAAAPP